MKKVILLFAILLTALITQAQQNIQNYSTNVIIPVALQRTISCHKHSGKIDVNANVDYSIDNDAKWLRIEKNNKGLKYYAEANTTISPRKTKITLKSEDGKIERYINITQEVKNGDNPEARAKEALKLMSLEDKVALIVGENSFYMKEIKSIGLPRLKQSDGPQGVRDGSQSTAYPCGALLAATWDKNIAYNYGQALGRDCRARGINFLLGPGVNIYRSPRNGRNFEYFGEDPWLASEIACNYINGVQSNKGVVAMIKHFAANFMEYGRLSMSSDVDTRTLHEIYLPVFRRAAQEAKVGSIMSSYNLLNGTYCFEDKMLMQDILRDMWGYKYLTASDWGAPFYGVGSGWPGDHVLNLLKYGVDLEAATPGYYQITLDKVKNYIQSNQLQIEEIDKKVMNILRTIYTYNLDEYTEADTSLPKSNQDNDKVAYEIATQGIVLLQNKNNTLPFGNNVKSLAIIGSNANQYVYGGGSGEVTPFHNTTTYDGLKEECDKRNIKLKMIDLSNIETLENNEETTFFYTDSAQTKPGFTAEYFNNTTTTGEPILTRIEQEINNPWNKKAITGLGTTNFSARFKTYIKCKSLSKCTFTLTADDGMTLKVGNNMLINDYKDNSQHTQTATMTLLPGKLYPIEIRYYQAAGDYALQFKMTRENENYQQEQIEKLNTYDAVIVCEGFNKSTEGENIDRTFNLPASARTNIQNVLKSTTPVILVINSGGAVNLANYKDRIPSILWSSYPGQEGGKAVSDILFGKVNPSGKLPMTFELNETDGPSYNYYKDTNKRISFKEGIYVGYRGFQKNNIQPLFPFGYGLSYTTFELSDLKATSTEATITVKNTGSCRGAEVVQIYVGPAEEGTIDRPAKELRGFEKVWLNPGESKTITIAIDDHAYSYFDVNQNKFRQLSGKYYIFAGNSSTNLPLQTTINIK